MSVNLIVAHDHNRGIGYWGKIPWNISEDLAYFRQLTMGHPVIMGVNTWKSLPNKPLDGRPNIVVYQRKQRSEYDFDQIQLDAELREKKVLLCSNLIEAIDLADTYSNKYILSQRKPQNFIIGGAKIYKEALARGLVDRIYVTLVHGFYPTDTFFPLVQNWPKAHWNVHKNYDGFEFDRYEYTLTQAASA